jgi:hypothetical protein
MRWLLPSTSDDGLHLPRLWITRPGPDQPPNGLIVLDYDAEGNRRRATRLDAHLPAARHHVETDDVWAGVGGETSAERVLLTVLGRVSPEARLWRE